MAAGSRDRHLERMSDAFCKFRESDVLCDTTLVTTDRVVLAHSVILASASDVFREAFQLSKGDANGQYRFELESISGAVMEAMLYLIYTGSLRVPYKDSASLAVIIKTCEQLGIRFTSRNLVDVSEIKELEVADASIMKLEDSSEDHEASADEATEKTEFDSCALEQDVRTTLASLSEDFIIELYKEGADNEAIMKLIAVDETTVAYPFVCDVCSEQFAIGTALRSHRRGHESCIDCVECGMCFVSRASLHEHLCRSCHAIVVVCNLCSKKCIGRGSLAEHAATEHNEAVVCPTCCQPFSDSDSSRLHQTLHESAVSFHTFMCTCGLHCHTKGDLEAHRATSHCDGLKSSVLFCCRACGQTFSKKNHMLDHLARYGVIDRSNSCKDGQLQRTCKYCGAVLRHSKMASKANGQLLPGEASLMCQVCRANSEVRDHPEKIEEVQPRKSSRSLSCANCSKTFTRISDLQAHVRRHTGEMGYNCPVCSREFRKKNTLQRHIRVHTGERPYVCEVCGKSFKIMFHLQLHRSIHLTERAFTCSICLKAFQSAVRLKKHSAIHTDVKPYSCPICARAFNRNGNMRAHMKIHDVDRNVPNTLPTENLSTEQLKGSYRCDVCGNTFTRLSGLRSHYARLHPESSLGDNLSAEVGSTSAVQVVYCRRVDDQADDSFISMPITVHFSDDESNFIC